MMDLPIDTIEPSAVAKAAFGDPHVEWLHEWRHVHAAWKKSDDETPQDKTTSARYDELSKLLANTPAKSIAGLSAQFAWFKEDLGYCVTDTVGDDYKGCLDTLAAGLSAALLPDSRPLNERGDRAAALLERWKAIHNAAQILARSLRNRIDNTPELDAMTDLRGGVGEQIAACTPQNDEDAAAMLEWCMLDCEGVSLSDEHLQAQQAVFAYLSSKQPALARSA